MPCRPKVVFLVLIEAASSVFTIPDFTLDFPKLCHLRSSCGPWDRWLDANVHRWGRGVSRRGYSPQDLWKPRLWGCKVCNIFCKTPLLSNKTRFQLHHDCQQQEREAHQVPSLAPHISVLLQRFNSIVKVRSLWIVRLRCSMYIWRPQNIGNTHCHPVNVIYMGSLKITHHWGYNFRFSLRRVGARCPHHILDFDNGANLQSFLSKEHHFLEYFHF